MNCDQAFDYLTDSTRRESDRLARHLAGCPRCRQLKETLEPALDLFDDVVPEPALGSSSVDGETTDDAVRLASQSASRLGGGRFGRRDWTRAVRYAAAFVIGASAALGMTLALETRSEPSVCAWKNRSSGVTSEAVQADAVVLSCVACHLPAE